MQYQGQRFQTLQRKSIKQRRKKFSFRFLLTLQLKRSRQEEKFASQLNYLQTVLFISYVGEGGIGVVEVSAINNVEVENLKLRRWKLKYFLFSREKQSQLLLKK